MYAFCGCVAHYTQRYVHVSVTTWDAENFCGPRERVIWGSGWGSESPVKICVANLWPNCYRYSGIYLLKSGCPTALHTAPRPQRRYHWAWRAAPLAEARSADSKQGQDDTERSEVSACCNYRRPIGTQQCPIQRYIRRPYTTSPSPS